MPFLDRGVIAHAMSLPADMKVLEEDGMEKGHLRRAFTGRRPEHPLWRRKEQFGTGSGAQGVLSPLGDGRITEDESAAALAQQGGARPLPHLPRGSAGGPPRRRPHPLRDSVSAGPSIPLRAPERCPRPCVARAQWLSAGAPRKVRR